MDPQAQTFTGSAATAVAALGNNPVMLPLFILGFAVILVALLAAVSHLRRRAMEQQGSLPDAQLQHWRTLLVDAVGEASQTQGARVNLRNFWRSSGLSKAQRFVVLQDLLRRQVLYRAYDPDRLVAFLQRVRWDFWHLPVAVVRLSDQHWVRLAAGAGAGVVANGDVILVQDSPGAGVVSRSSDVNQTMTQEVTPDLIQGLVEALRTDAKALVSGHDLREQAESLADTLERDSVADRSSAVKKTVSDVLEFTANGAGLWAATLAILGVR